ncbi:MAG: aminotransferase class I/II-fold pyridoxal phosphate-dependent enzyme [Limisphaerales bacterium]
MSDFDQELNRRLDAIRVAGLFRELRRVDSPQAPHLRLNGRPLLNFSSNDYLGLANDPALKTAAIEAVERAGAGSGASRLVCGSLAPHHELEEALAAFKGAEAALAFSSGYAAAVGTICALVDQDDVIVLDKLAHACIVDAARLCGAKLRVFAHNDLNDLEQILRWADSRHSEAAAGRRSRTLVVTESVFSMDGDHAPLRELADLKDRFGAWLMVDEAHATGLFGAHRRGLAEACGVGDRIEIQMGTLGKALGAAGGFISGPRVLTDYLVNRARTFIFSTAPVPAAAAAGAAAVRFVQSGAGQERLALLWRHQAEVARTLSGLLPDRFSHQSPIFPILIGDELEAVRVADDLRGQGIFIPAIRFPTVARGAARLRLTITAAHTETDIVQLAAALRSVRIPHSASRTPPSPPRHA